LSWDKSGSAGADGGPIVALRWEHVSEEHESLFLPDSKTGRKAIHLSPPALTLLQAIPRLEGNPYVICGERPGRHLVNGRVVPLLPAATPGYLLYNT
jgi:integrase